MSTSSALCEWMGFFKGHWGLGELGPGKGTMEKQELQRLHLLYFTSLMGKGPQHQALRLPIVGGGLGGVLALPLAPCISQVVQGIKLGTPRAYYDRALQKGWRVMDFL